MFEKRLAAIQAQAFTANGGANGSVTIADTTPFRVQQLVVITATGQVNLELEVKRVSSATELIVGPIQGSPNAFTDLSAYTTAATAQIFANEQRRPLVTSDDFERAVYEEEPLVAKRTILVDEKGNKINAANPLPTSATLTVPPITVDTVGQGAANTNANAWPVKVSDGTDTVGISTVAGTKALKVDVLQTGFVARSVVYIYTLGNVTKIETTIGTKKRVEDFTYDGNGNLTNLAVTIVDV